MDWDWLVFAKIVEGIVGFYILCCLAVIVEEEFNRWFKRKGE